MKHCPNCQHTFQVEGESHKNIIMDHCPQCYLIWLDFGKERPHLYREIEKQVIRWEEQKLKRRKA